MTARNDAPFRKNASDVPNAAIDRPATAGPTIRAALKIAELSATAFVTSSRPTISTENACRVGMSMAFVKPSRSASTKMCHTCTVLVAVSTASTNASVIADACVTISVRRFGRWSATRPPNRPNTSTGVNCAAATSPSANGLPVSARTSQAWATVCIQVPTRLISCPRKKSR